MVELFSSISPWIAKELSSHLHRVFPDLQHNIVKFEDRIKVIEDSAMYNASLDESVWLQTKGLAPIVYQIYFDGVHIANFKQDDIEQAVVLVFFRGFKKAYDEGKIHFYTEEYKLQQELKEAQEKDEKTLEQIIDETPATTKEEKMAKEIVKNVVKKAKKKDA